MVVLSCEADRRFYVIPAITAGNVLDIEYNMRKTVILAPYKTKVSKLRCVFLSSFVRKEIAKYLNRDGD